MGPWLLFGGLGVLGYGVYERQQKQKISPQAIAQLRPVQATFLQPKPVNQGESTATQALNAANQAYNSAKSIYNAFSSGDSTPLNSEGNLIGAGDYESLGSGTSGDFADASDTDAFSSGDELLG